MSYWTASKIVITPPNIKVLSITELWARSLECLSTSINCIDPKINLDTGMTRNTSREACEGAYSTGTMLPRIATSMKRSRRGR